MHLESDRHQSTIGPVTDTRLCTEMYPWVVLIPNISSLSCASDVRAVDLMFLIELRVVP